MNIDEFSQQVIKWIKAFNEIIKALTPLIASISLLVGAIALFWGQINGTRITQSDKKIDQVGKGTQENKNNIVVQQHSTAASPSPPVSDSLVVQLASYLPFNCDVAQTEIDGYKGRFPVEPKLWRPPNSAFIVVGIPANNAQQADALKHDAQALAPEFKQNDLKDAVIRSNKGWEQITACPQQ